MKKLFSFIPFLLCFFTALLPGVILITAGGASRVFPAYACTACGAGIGLLLFFFCAKDDRLAAHSRLLFLLADAALAFLFIICFTAGGFPAGACIAAAAASAFLFGSALAAAEQLASRPLFSGLLAAAALAAALLLSSCFARVPAAAFAAGIAACICHLLLALLQGPLLFPDAPPLLDRRKLFDPRDVLGKTRAQRLQEFAELHHLTPRETEVLCIVVDNDCALKEVALDLKISERMVQRYMTSIYQKTGTQSRIGLSLKYFNDFRR